MTTQIDYAQYNDEELEQLFFEVSEEQEKRRRRADLPHQIEALVANAVELGVSEASIADAVERGSSKAEDDNNHAKGIHDDNEGYLLGRAEHGTGDKG